MSLQNTPSAERVHIGIFGRTNAGKSSLINAVTGQNLAIVSDIKGTTTDPVSKAMELLPIGAVVLIDTPGLDDTSELGKARTDKAYRVMDKTDIAVAVIGDGIKSAEDEALLKKLAAKKIPTVVVYNKSDELEKLPQLSENELAVSCKTGDGIEELKNTLGKIYLNSVKKEMPYVSDLINGGDTVILVTPIDEAAPKGRLILPQQQVLRDVLDKGAFAVVVKETEYERALASLKEKPALVVTDSKVFGEISKATPKDIPLTSFSIIMARRKGTLSEAVRAVKTLNTLSDGDKILISEGCTHHRQCGDIGTIKLPMLIRKYTGKDLVFEHTSGTEFTENLDSCKLIVHCGACMLNEREMKSRAEKAKAQGVPMTNFGIIIAYVTGILERSTKMLNLK